MMLRADAVHCMLYTCSVQEGLSVCSLSESSHDSDFHKGAVNHTTSVCILPPRDQSRALLTTTLSLYAIVLIFVVIRVITRISKRVKLSGGKDDALVIAAFLVASPAAFLAPIWCQDMGKDAWMVPLAHITRSALILIIFEVLYVIAIGLTKAAILLFYIRIFPSISVRRTAWAVICLMVAYSAALIIFGLVQCRPFNYSWRRFTDEHGGKCLEITTAATVHGALNVAMDVVILLLPMPAIYRLRVCTKKKVQIAIMFR